MYGPLRRAELLNISIIHIERTSPGQHAAHCSRHSPTRRTSPNAAASSARHDRRRAPAPKIVYTEKNVYTETSPHPSDKKPCKRVTCEDNTFVQYSQAAWESFGIHNVSVYTIWQYHRAQFWLSKRTSARRVALASQTSTERCPRGAGRALPVAHGTPRCRAPHGSRVCGPQR